MKYLTGLFLLLAVTVSAAPCVLYTRGDGRIVLHVNSPVLTNGDIRGTDYSAGGVDFAKMAVGTGDVIPTDAKNISAITNFVQIGLTIDAKRLVSELPVKYQKKVGNVLTEKTAGEKSDADNAEQAGKSDLLKALENRIIAQLRTVGVMTPAETFVTPAHWQALQAYLSTLDDATEKVVMERYMRARQRILDLGGSMSDIHEH